MRTLLALTLFIAASSDHAQVCQQMSLGVGGGTQTGWDTQSDMSPDGGLVGILSNDFGQRGVIVTHIGPDNDLDWTQVVTPTNPAVTLAPKVITAMPDGGAVVFGSTSIMEPDLSGFWRNSFGIRLSNTGQVMWARYYMYHTNMISGSWSQLEATALPNGEVMLAMNRTTGISVIRLDQGGMPVWESRADFPGGTYYHPPIGIDADGAGGVFVSAGSSGQFQVLHYDGSNTLDWAKSYADVGDWMTTQRVLPNGDLLMTGVREAVQLD
ncbi:MAG TPA: hypothetical protein VKG92_00370, partial [Flavobacteriales bacterium]|nr:hypothetical protein [Flavobacteriales bacterium]